MDYKETLLLPQTLFDMRANLPQKEPSRYAAWSKADVYGKMKKNRATAKESFTLHDGPPYANGHLHIGHALNKILKDIIVKHNYFQGKSVRFTPGWDCHGLPIEQEVEKGLGKEKKDSLEKSKLRELCREHARKFIDIQREEFRSMGVIADWEKPYLTMDFAFEANIYRQLCAIAKNGLLVQRSKPVYWSWAAKTALAEAEVEYKDKESWSIFVAFALNDQAAAKIGAKEAKLVIWTTTPWTLPANVGISLNPHEKYALTTDGYIVAESLVESCVKEGLFAGGIEKSFSAMLLENETAINPLNGRNSRIVLGEHVLTDSGTGAVHTAPGHGEDDYRIGLRYGLDVVMPVDESGCYDETVVRMGLLPDAQSFVGVQVFKANEQIMELLGNALLKSQKFTHSYPHCWRTHTPVLFRATKQWFVAMDEKYGQESSLRDVAMSQIEHGVHFVPSSGKNRLGSMISQRPDWCISRQRDWGVPIAFFRHKKSGDILFDHNVLEKTASLFEKHGCDAWYSLGNSEFLSEFGYEANEYEKERDILDVWFDSGSTFAAVLKSGNYDAGSFPADLYLEGSDQHRGWFQSSLLVGCATQLRSPYKQVLTHGFTVDATGRKMSKSLGNVVAPEKVLKEYGSEILRLWVAMSDFSDDVKISPEILKQTAEQYRKMRNTFRFLLANICDLETPASLESFGVLDRWILSEAKIVFDEAKREFDSYDFARAMSRLSAFVATKLSGIYLDICKDRLYCDAKDAPGRRASQTAMLLIAKSLLGLVASVLTYTADEIIEQAPKVLKGQFSDVFDFVYEPLPQLKSGFDDAYWLEARGKFSEIVDELKKQGVIKSTLELQIAKNGVEHHQEIADWFMVSAVLNDHCGDKLGEFAVGDQWFVIAKSTAHKCPRCWKYTAKAEESLCERCAEVLA